MSLGMPEFDLGTERGRQDFQDWITNNMKNEMNSYARQVLRIPNSGLTGPVSTGSESEPLQFIDGGTPATVFNNFYLTGGGVTC